MLDVTDSIQLSCQGVSSAICNSLLVFADCDVLYMQMTRIELFYMVYQC